MRSKTSVLVAAAGLLLSTLISCSSGGGDGNKTSTYAVSGTVSGLTGIGLVLQNNGEDDLSITSNATFTFAKRVVEGSAYAVTVKTHPFGQSCFVSNGTGTAAVDVVNVSVVCHASGSLDAGFGANGNVTTPAGTGYYSSAQAVTAQADGRIVAAGTNNTSGSIEFAVVRYTTDGALDPSFGTNGIVSTVISTSSGNVGSMVIQPDQKIVVAGSDSNFALVRYTSEGTLDPSFGVSGIVSTPVGTGSARVYALAVQSDNKILAAGLSQAAFVYDAVLARYLPNGELDSTFGTGGKVVLDVGPYDEFVAVFLQPDNKILVAGNTDFTHFLLARYLADGTPDTAFGTNGIVFMDIAGSAQDLATDMIRQPDGKIVLGGTIESSPSLFTFALVRYNENGSIDTAFGTNGIVTVPILCNNDFGAKVALQADGKIVVTAPGSVTGAAPHDTMIVRYLPNGTLDAGFGTNGKVTASMATSSDIPYDITIQADGMIVVAGVDSWGSLDSNFVIERLYP